MLSPNTAIFTGAVCAWICIGPIEIAAKKPHRTSSNELTGAAKRPYPLAKYMAVTRPPIVRLNDVHLDMASDAGTVNILRGVTLDIAAGEITAVVGPSGA